MKKIFILLIILSINLILYCSVVLGCDILESDTVINKSRTYELCPGEYVINNITIEAYIINNESATIPDVYITCNQTILSGNNADGFTISNSLLHVNKCEVKEYNSFITVISEGRYIISGSVDLYDNQFENTTHVLLDLEEWGGQSNIYGNLFKNVSSVLYYNNQVLGTVNIIGNKFLDCGDGFTCNGCMDIEFLISNNLFQNFETAIDIYQSSGHGQIMNNEFLNGGNLEFGHTSPTIDLFNNKFENMDYVAYWTYSDGNIINNNFTNMDSALIFGSPHIGNKKNNNFINNTINIDYVAYISAPDPVFENYYSDFDEPFEGCEDNNTDSICDSPYIFNEFQDDPRPYICINGWTDGCYENNIELIEGWNLISVPLILNNMSANSIFENVSYSGIYTYESTGYVLVNRNELISISKGYWINANNDYNITLTGTLINSLNYSLTSGYNLISYPSVYENNVTYVFGNVNSSVVNILTYDNKNKKWLSYDFNKNNSLNTITTIKPGNAYFVNLNKDINLSFDGRFS